MYNFGRGGQELAASAKFRHGRELCLPIAQQGMVRPNRDTFYSFAIVDLDAGPVTIMLPDAGKRFMGDAGRQSRSIHSGHLLRRGELHPDSGG